MNDRKQTFNNKSDILNFGKYKGETIEWVLENDPGYILWLDESKVAIVRYEIFQEAEMAQYGEKDDIPMNWNLYNFHRGGDLD